MKEDNTIEWGIIVRKILNQTTPEEDQLFQKWLDGDERNRTYFKKAGNYFERYYNGNEERNIETLQAWNEFMEYTRKPKSRISVRLLKYAAIIIFPLLCSWFAYTLFTDNKTNVPTLTRQELLPGETKAVLVLGNGKEIQLSDKIQSDTLATESNVVINHQANSLFYNKKGNTTSDDISQNKVITPRGGEYQVILSDGTRVTLNAESQLIFPVEFPEDLRHLQLIGEAYFEVTRNEQAPFTIETQSGVIKVLGTTFNVSAYPNDDIVQTTLVTGSVSFTQPAKTQAQVINPGEQITYHKSDQSTHIEKVNTDLYCGWRDGKFIMEDERLEDILKRLARWYDIEIFFQNEKAKDLVFTGDLEKYDTCDVILNIIELSTNVTFDIKERTITVMMRH